MVGRRHIARIGGWALALALLGGAAPADAAISLVASSTGSSSTTSMAVTAPNNIATNDTLVAVVSGAGTGAINPPAGTWTIAADTTTGTAMRTYVWVHTVASSDGSSYTFTWTGSRNVGGGITGYRGVNTNVPIDDVSTATGTSGNAVSPLVTTSSAGDLVVVASATAKTTTWTAPSGTTERWDKSSSGTATELADFTQATAGNTTARTATPASGTAAWTAQAVALRDNSAAGLSVSTSAASASFSADLNAGDSTPTYTVSPTILDTRSGASAGLGWQLQVTSTTLTAGTHTLATTATSITGETGDACVQQAPCVLPTSNVTYPVAVPAAGTAPTAVKFDNAAVNTGEGQISNTATFTVTVPQNTFAGSYTSTVTISIVSGP